MSFVLLQPIVVGPQFLCAHSRGHMAKPKYDDDAGGPAATAQGGPAATAQGGPAATARVPSTPSLEGLVRSMQNLYEESQRRLQHTEVHLQYFEALYEDSQRRLQDTEQALRFVRSKNDILEGLLPRTGRKRDHTNTERERGKKIRKRPSSGKDEVSHSRG